MSKINNKDICIQERDGSVHPFDVMSLQTRLIGTFLAAGRRDDSYLADDIALAVEYTLSQLPRPELVFARGEIDAAVIRLLEETGFPDVAKSFRKGGAVESTATITADRDTLSELLRRFFCTSSDERFNELICKTLNAAKTLEISAAAPHLWLELARYYDTQLEPDPAEREIVTHNLVTLTREELYQILPETARNFMDLGILRINGVTSLFPSVHFFFMLNTFAFCRKLSGMVTELEIEPMLIAAGGVLEEARLAIEKKLNMNGKQLPCLLDIPDMFDFITDYAGGDRLKSDKLATDLAEMLAAKLNCELYKLSLG